MKLNKLTLILVASLAVNIIFAFAGLSYMHRKGFTILDIPHKLIKAEKVDSASREFFRRHASIYEECVKYHKKNSTIVFLGDSITHNATWHEFFQKNEIVNRGINGDTTVGLIKRLDQVLALYPKKIFLMIGTNDIDRKRSVDEICSNIETILDEIKNKSPTSKVYIQSITPVRGYKAEYVKSIKKINIKLKNIANERGYPFIDLYSPLVDYNDNLNENYTIDGLHLNGKGYGIWLKIIKNFVLND